MSETFDVVVTRIFDAPVERVWRAWSEGAEVRKWWGPTGFTCPLAEVDFREGGRTHVVMRAPPEYGGMEIHNTWTYTRIRPLQSFEYILNFVDKEGRKLKPADIGTPPGIPEDGRHVVVFKSLPDGRTEMLMTEHGYTIPETRDLSQLGLEQCLDKMAASFASASQTA
jgi:uncharacterized protein YndB with AHSA1/START domain